MPNGDIDQLTVLGIEIAHEMGDRLRRIVHAQLRRPVLSLRRFDAGQLQHRIPIQRTRSAYADLRLEHQSRSNLFQSPLPDDLPTRDDRYAVRELLRLVDI